MNSTPTPTTQLLGAEPSLPLGDRHPLLIGPLARTFLGSKDLGGGPVAAGAIHLGVLNQDPIAFWASLASVDDQPADLLAEETSA